jgi:hypothetical protein
MSDEQQPESPEMARHRKITEAHEADLQDALAAQRHHDRWSRAVALASALIAIASIVVFVVVK